MLGADGNKPTGKSDKRKRKARQEGRKAEPRQPKSAQPMPDRVQDDVEPITAFVASTEDVAATAAAADLTAAASAEPLPIEDQAIANAGQDEIAAQEIAAELREHASAPPQEPTSDRLQDALNAVNAAVASIAHAPIAPAPTDSAAIAPAAPAAPAEATPTAPEQTTPIASADAAAVSYQAIANAYGNFTRHSLDQTRSFFERLAGVRSIDKAFELQTEFAKQAYDSFVAESQKIGALHSEMARQRLKRWEGLVVGITKPF